MTKLYIAYGSNLNVNQMASRCPQARMIGTTEIRDTRLVFRGVADVVHAKGMSVPVGVWSITDQCEEALDRYEGVSSGMYRKEYVAFDDGEKGLLYVMNSTGIFTPSQFYFDAIRQGYKDFGIDEAPLHEALAHSRKAQNLTHDVLNAHRRRTDRDARNIRLAR